MLKMSIFLVIVAVGIFACLVLVSSFRPVRSEYSHTELKRRAKKSDAFALELDRYELSLTVYAMLRIVRAILLVLLVCALIGAIGWFFGAVAAIIAAVTYPFVGRTGLVSHLGALLYKKVEPWLLKVADRFERVLHGLREPSSAPYDVPKRLHSQEELSEVIARSGDVVGEREKTLLAAALAFPDKTVESIMTPRSVIDFIKKDEFLGPLVLDELHALGHSRLPVIANDLDHVVGVLHLRDLLSLDVKRSSTAEKAMEQKVFYIRSDDTLEHALAAFIRTRHHLFIVINKSRETVGILTLEDVMEALIGRRIVDEDDIHADLRAVAEQEGKTRNTPKEHVDL